MLTGWQWVIVLVTVMSAATFLVAKHMLPDAVWASLAGGVVTLFAKPRTKDEG